MHYIYTFCVLQVAFFRLKFVKVVFVSSYYLASASLLYGPIILSHVSGESSMALAKYFPFSQLHVAGF